LILSTTLLTSLVLDYPHLPGVHPLAKPDEVPYLLDVLATAFSPRLRDQDFLLVTSFWGTFGWVNRALPELVVTTLTVLTTTAAVLTVAGVYRRDGRQGVARIGLVIAGAVASLAAYAVSTLRYSPDIQGRYLVGLYLCMICLAFTDALELVVRRPWTSVVLLSVLVMGYAAVLGFLLNSYF